MEEEGLKELGKAMGLAKSTPGKVAPARTLKIMDHSTTQLFQEEIVVKDPNQLLAQKVISIIRRYGNNVYSSLHHLIEYYFVISLQACHPKGHL